MNRKLLVLLWGVIAWVTPAAIAGTLDWNGIWGAGNAFADYLIPVPIAGGFLHLPSFVLVSSILLTQPWTGKPGGYERGALLAGALVGVATLLDLNELQLSASTDAGGGWSWQEQPLGLFIVTDFLIAQLFVGAFGGRWPTGGKEWATSLALVLAIPLIYSAMSLQADPRQRNPLVHTGSRPGEVRGDESVFYYSKLPPSSDEFRQAASAVLERHDPRNNINVEDIAIHFFDSLASAQSQDSNRAVYTVCIYQDGTAASWYHGSADCFRDHESFSERLEAAYAAQDSGLPQDVRIWLARRAACTGRKPLVAPPGMFIDNQEVRSCDPARSSQAYKELLQTFEHDEKVVILLQSMKPGA